MDNKYYNYNCPPLMNDGRFISSYVRSSTFDQYVRNVNNIETGTSYRHYLQNNGDTIINNIKGYLHQNNTCSVGGKCLPMSGPITPLVPKPVEKEQWYEEMLDDEPPQLDFMMHKNELQNTDISVQNQPTFIKSEECTTCTRN